MFAGYSVRDHRRVPCSLIALGGLFVLVLATTNSTNAEVLTPLTPIVGVHPNPIDFGCEDIGNALYVTADLVNAADDPQSLLEVTQLTVTGNGFALVSGPTLPVFIPGDSTIIELVLEFSPPSEGEATGTYHQVGTRIALTKFEGSDATYTILGYYSPHLTPDERGVAFLSIGGGVIGGGEESEFILSLGGGAKAFVAESAAIRVEYRYDRISFDFGDINQHRIVFGISGFLSG